jgi:hypothetical protein
VSSVCPGHGEDGLADEGADAALYQDQARRQNVFQFRSRLHLQRDRFGLLRSDCVVIDTTSPYPLPRSCNILLPAFTANRWSAMMSASLVWKSPISLRRIAFSNQSPR